MICGIIINILSITINVEAFRKITLPPRRLTLATTCQTLQRISVTPMAPLNPTHFHSCPFICVCMCLFIFSIPSSCHPWLWHFLPSRHKTYLAGDIWKQNWQSSVPSWSRSTQPDSLQTCLRCTNVRYAMLRLCIAFIISLLKEFEI